MRKSRATDLGMVNIGHVAGLGSGFCPPRPMRVLISGCATIGIRSNDPVGRRMTSVFFLHFGNLVRRKAMCFAMHLLRSFFGRSLHEAKDFPLVDFMDSSLRY